MATYTLDDLVNAVHDDVATAASLERDESQAEDEITEGIHDWPLIQTWMAGNRGTSFESDTDRLTLSGKHSVKEYLIYSDLYVAQRSHVGEAMGKLLSTINEIEDILDTRTYDLYGADYITSFNWSWDQVTFEYGGVKYTGARFSIIIRAGTTR
ncbi:MAG: hypothetical protein JSV86_06950 [Gemmatimonadota bacterium]|nr:MAG: hypothetical protein JSV86_06950 [Gemmatimonadota bacterium]